MKLLITWLVAVGLGMTSGARLMRYEIRRCFVFFSDEANQPARELALAAKHLNDGFLDFDNQPLRAPLPVVAAAVIALAVQPAVQTGAAFGVVFPVRCGCDSANVRPHKAVAAGHVWIAAA